MSRKKIDTNHSNMQKSDLKLPKMTLDNIDDTNFVATKIPRHKVFFSRLKRKLLKHVYFVRLLLISLIILFLFLFSSFGISLLRHSQIGYYASLIKTFFLTPTDSISSIDGRVNFLILGKGGDGHEGPDLTDTIIFSSIKSERSDKPFGIGSKSQISLISLPRDIWIAPLRTKLNSVYYWGNQKQQDGGLILAKSTVEEILDQPVQYGVVIDFSGFRRIIDVLDGIEVDIQNSFTDFDFPIAGRENDLCNGDTEYRCRYETISFNKGMQKMDGETALKFVRSRHAEGDEGTDLARAARQEKVIAAIKNKVLSREILLKPKKIIELKDVVLESIETDVTPETAAVLARWFMEGRENISSTVLSEDLLENPPKLTKYDNLYVFIPKEIDESEPSGYSWSKIQEWIKCKLENGSCYNNSSTE